MQRLVAVFAFIALIAFGAPALAQEHGDAAAPHGSEWLQQKIKVCASCHGKTGASPTTPNFPIIAGQYESYLFHALKSYRNGERKNPIMSAQVANMTNAQLRALAAWFAKQESPLYTPTLER